MNEKVKAIERKYTKAEKPEFNVGDSVKVHVRIKEGDKERTQAFEGTVLARQGNGPERDVHGAPGRVRCGGGEDLPGERPERAEHRRHPPREGEAGEAQLPQDARRARRRRRSPRTSSSPASIWRTRRTSRLSAWPK